jgi:hypothetical protein
MATNPQPSFSPGRRWKIGFDVVVRTALVLAVVVMVNYLGAKFYSRFYLSSQTQVKLSTRTLSVIHSVTNHVAITVYYDKTDDWYPAIIALLNEYRSANPNITVKAVDYVRDAGEAQKVKAQYKLSSATDKDLVIFDSGGHIKIVNGDALTQVKLEQVPNATQREFRKKPIAFNGEVMFTSKLLTLAHAQPLRAYFLQGHGESSLADNTDNGFAKFGLALAQNDLTVNNLELLGDAEVPLDCSLLIVAAPIRALADPELQKIDKYLAQGGRLLALFNYASIARPTGLEPILQRWGVNVGTSYVKDAPNSLAEQMVVVRKFNPKTFVNPLAQLAVEMVLPRPVEKLIRDNPSASAPQVEELAASSETSTLASDPAAPPRGYSLIATVEQKPVAGVTNPRGNTRMVVAGDSLFLDNQIIDAAANRDFLNYSINWLLDRQELLAGIGPRPVTEFRLQVTRQQQQQLNWLLLGALPGGVLIFGWLVWLVRRK